MYVNNFEAVLCLNIKYNFEFESKFILQFSILYHHSGQQYRLKYLFGQNIIRMF